MVNHLFVELRSDPGIIDKFGSNWTSMLLKPYSHSSFDSPVFHAVMIGTNDIVKVLIEAERDAVTMRDRAGYTLLSWAMRSKNLTLAKFIISKGGRLYPGDDDNHQMVEISIESGDPSLVRLLLQHGTITTEVDPIPMLLALQRAYRGGPERHFEVAEILIGKSSRSLDRSTSISY